MSDPIQDAEKLALSVWDFLSEHHVTGSATEKQRAAIRTAAFKFSREVKSGDEWLHRPAEWATGAYARFVRAAITTAITGGQISATVGVAG